MKKFLIFLIFIFTIILPVQAHHCHNHAYVTYQDFYQEELRFPNCNKHYLLKETTTYFYSNGTKRSYITSTILNADGTVFESGCSDVKHISYKNKHYFTFYKNKKYQIVDEYGKTLTIQNYKKMKEVAPNRLIVKLNKKYGVIDLQNNIIVPIKYKEFEQISDNLFKTKLNGYYGMTTLNNKVVLKNEYDKIKSLGEIFLIKKYNKYGLVDKQGKVLLHAINDSIKLLDEYVIVEFNNKYNVYSSVGEMISNVNYKKIRLNRNSLEGKNLNNKWETIL